MAGDSASGRSMQIGEIAHRSGLSLRTLRHYDDVGLLRPSGRSDGGFRLYTEDDLERLLVIRRMKPLGFSLEQMVEVMRRIETLRAASAAADDDTDRPSMAEVTSARHALGDVLEQARERRDQLRSQLAMADEFIELLGQQ